MIDSAPPSGLIIGKVPCVDAVGRPRDITVTTLEDRQAVTLLMPPGESATLTAPAARHLAALLSALP